MSMMLEKESWKERRAETAHLSAGQSLAHTRAHTQTHITSHHTHTHTHTPLNTFCLVPHPLNQDVLCPVIGAKNSTSAANISYLSAGDRPVTVVFGVILLLAGYRLLPQSGSYPVLDSDNHRSHSGLASRVQLGTTRHSESLRNLIDSQFEQQQQHQ